MSALARGGALNAVGIVINVLTGFLFAVVLARALGAQGAGSFFEAVAVFTILWALAQFGAGTGLIRMVSRSMALGRVRDVRPLIRVGTLPVLAFSSLLALLLFAFAPQLTDLLITGTRSSGGVDLRILALFLPIAVGTSVALAATRGLGAMLPFVVIERVGPSAMRVPLAIIALLAGFGATGFIVLWAAPFVLAFAAAWVWLILLVRRAEHGATYTRPSGRDIRELAAEFWRFSAYRGVAALLQVNVRWLDVLLVGALASTRQAGIYAAASRVLGAGSFAIQAVLVVIGPQVSALLARGERDRVQAVYQVSSTWLVVLSFPVYLSIAAFAPFVLGIFGSEFKKGTTALVILCGAMLIDMAAGAVTTVLLMAGKSSFVLWNSAATLATNVCLNVLLVPSFGMTGAAVAWAASIVVQNVAPLIQVWLSLGLHPLSAGLSLAVAASALCYGGLGVAFRFWLGTSVQGFVAFVLSATMLYVMVLYAARRPLELDVAWRSLGRRPSVRLST